MHGKQIIDAAILPIGTLSGQAEEVRNKDYRRYRLAFSRKYDRISTNTDIFHRLLATSDPYITSLRRQPNKNALKLYPIVMEMIEE